LWAGGVAVDTHIVPVGFLDLEELFGEVVESAHTCAGLM